MIASDVLGALLVLAVVFMAGGLAGLLCAWTQEARCVVWANKVHALYLRAAELEERGKS